MCTCDCSIKVTAVSLGTSFRNHIPDTPAGNDDMYAKEHYSNLDLSIQNFFNPDNFSRNAIIWMKGFHCMYYESLQTASFNQHDRPTQV